MMANRCYSGSIYLYEAIYLTVAENEINNSSESTNNLKVCPVKLSEFKTLFNDFSKEINLNKAGSYEINESSLIEDINGMLQNAFNPDEYRLTLFLYEEDNKENKMKRIDNPDLTLHKNDFEDNRYYISTQSKLK